MVELLAARKDDDNFAAKELLHHNEVIVIVDDSPEIALLLSNYLQLLDVPYQLARCARDFYALLDTHHVALVLLDIGLPDEDGTDVLRKIAPDHPDLGIIMVTATADLQVALQCLREGADDYLTKPLGIERFNHTILETLKKRRIAIDNRIFQRELEATNYRTQFLHHLNLKMNTAYLGAVELSGVLHSILVGITSQEGLQFNRAFLALFDEENLVLHGTLAIGPSKREEANRLWTNIADKNLKMQDMIDEIVAGNTRVDRDINQLVQAIEIPAIQVDHVLIRACQERRSIKVHHGSADGCEVQRDLLTLLDEENFVITPLYSPSKSLGVIIADNFVTRKEITAEDINALEIFANQASLAIEHSQLYREMSRKIKELELANQAIERSKDLLIEADRMSTLGHMSAQVVHAIRNPITALGGTARLLSRKLEDPGTGKFLQIIIKEAAKVESTLEDLFNYVDEGKLHYENQSVNTLLQQSVSAFYPTMHKKSIDCQLHLSDQDPVLSFDVQKIRQVFYHLIKNGIEAMDKGGMLNISSKVNETSCLVMIEDSGHGIEDSVLEKASDAFFTTKTYGTGMGLTLVEQILSQHHASFALTRNEESGMLATITFPL